MTHILNRAPKLGPVIGSTTDIEEPAPKAAAIVKDAATLLDPSIQPDTPYELPKMSLPDMSYWLMDLRLRLRFKAGPLTGTDGDLALVTLTPRDAAVLERIADSLNYLHRERLKGKWAKGRPATYSGRQDG
jgi:hypothetical protein